METWVVVNPAAGGGRGRARARALRGALEDAFGAVCWVETRGPDDVTEAARAAVRAGAARVLVAGGDGTVRLAAAGLAGRDVALGVLPVGTGNDVAAAMGLPRRLADVVPALARVAGAPVAIDLGRVTPLAPPRDGDGGAAPRWFACVLGVGVDTPALERIDGARFLPRGRLLYATATVQALARHAPERVRVAVTASDALDALDAPGASQVVFDGDATLVVVAGTPTYAGGLPVAPGARLDDGALDLGVFPPRTLREHARHLPALLRGATEDPPGVVRARCRAVRIDAAADDATARGAGGPGLPVTLDGERTALRTPVLVEVVPGALRVLAPGQAPAAPPARRHLAATAA